MIILIDSRVLKRRDSPIINYSALCHPLQPYSALPVYYFWRVLPASPFVLDPPFINSCAQSIAEDTTTSAALEMLVKVPSTSFVPLSGQGMDDEPEEDASFLNEIGHLFDSRKTSTFFLLHRTKLCSDYNEARQSMKRRIKQKNKAKSFFM